MASNQVWTPIEEEFWGHINVERKGTVISVCACATCEENYRDKDYIIAPLPDDVRVCQLVDAPAAVTIPDEVADTIRGLLEMAIAGRESVIRIRRYSSLPSGVEDAWLKRYTTALQWLDTQP